MNLFLDTNILIDLLADRKPFSQWAYRIFKDQQLGIHQLYASSNSILTSYYIIEKILGRKSAIMALKNLVSRIDVIPIDKALLLSSMLRQFTDYEDAVQHDCALSVKDLDYIITRNKRDFKKGVIKVMSSEELYT